MHTRSLRITLAAAAVLGGCFLSATTASAQIDPEGGDVWVPPADTPPAQPAPQQQPAQQPWYQGGSTQPAQPTPAPQPAQPQPEQAPAEPADGRSDHSRVVGRLAVGYMGTSIVPLGDLNAAGGVGSVTTPSIGVRYWLGDLVGLDVGLGIGFIGGSIETASVSAPVDSAFGMLIHGGVPLAIYHERHYSFLIIPEVNLGFSTGTHFGGNPDDDRGRSGFLFELGGRLGTEIHFGFMNIPQLSLQASVGLYFRYESIGIAGSRSNPVDRGGVSTYSLATSVHGEPWDILLGSLTALYYF